MSNMQVGLIEDVWVRLWHEPFPGKLDDEHKLAKGKATAFISLVESSMVQLAFGDTGQRVYIAQFLGKLMLQLPNLNERECNCIARHIEKLHGAMSAYGVVIPPVQSTGQHLPN